MTKIFCISLSLFSTFAFAGLEPQKKQIPVEAPTAKYSIDMDFAMERPITESIHMDVSVLCKDQRSKQNSARPQLETLVKGEKICAFDDYKFDKASQILTIKYSTGQFDKNDEASCDDHWQQQIDTKEVCQNWSADTRNPANDSIAAGGDDNQVTDFSSSNRHHRGVRERTRVRENQYYNSSWGENNPSFNANALFGGAMVGTYPQQGKYAGRDGLPRNSRREVIECPHMGVSSCLSAIFAAETSCNPTLHHRGHGYGLCAIENDGRRKRFGAACDDIRSTSGQITCCQAILDQQGSKYFGGRTKRIAGAACGWR